MLPIDLGDPASLPPEFSARLQRFDSVFRRCEYADSLTDDAGVKAVADDLEKFLRGQAVIGYHCTREPASGYFQQHGLRLLDLEAHQGEFLSRFGSHFTSAEVAEIRDAWQKHFVVGRQAKHREGMLWFCLTKATAYSQGAEVFLKFFGGEAVFMPLKRHATVAEKLGQLGTPAVVSVRLPPGAPSPHRSLALPLISAYHRMRRPDAFPYLAETNIRNSVPPGDVLAVTYI